MQDSALIKEEVKGNGFSIIRQVYTGDEVKAILESIRSVDKNNPSFRKTADLFAIRRLFKEIPTLLPGVFTDKLKALITNLFGSGYYVVKSIYFDKPVVSNWLVVWHQDLTISVENKNEVIGYGPWTVKDKQYAVQPPVDILQDNFTIRIHLDDTTSGNGALKVIPGSHLNGIIRPETTDNDKAVVCEVPKGGVMIMKPLLLHASGRTTNGTNRRVIHIEFSRQTLPAGLQWSEKMELSIPL